jgi:hypothetical protein
VEQAIPNKPAGIRIAYKITGIVGLNITLGLLFCGEPFLAFIIEFVLFIWVAIPTMFMSLVCRLMLKSRPTWGLLELGRACRWIAIWILLLLPVCPIAMVAANYRLEATKRHCENLIPRLEQWQTQYGRYPTTLMEIEESNSHRWLLEFDYRLSETGFSFSIIDPSAFLGLWVYDSEEHQWFEED